MSRNIHYERSTRKPVNSLATSRRAGLGQWVPLGLTILAVTVGIAAWIWSEHQDDDEGDNVVQHDSATLDNDEQRYQDGGIYSAPPSYREGSIRSGEMATGTTAHDDESLNYVTRMSGALRQSPSPQQFVDGVRRTVVAGVTATGAAVGSALSKTREEDGSAFVDHKTWAEEAEARSIDARQGAGKASDIASRSVKPDASWRRKTVAIVLAAEATSDAYSDDKGYHHQHSVSRIWPDFAAITDSLQKHPFDKATLAMTHSTGSSYDNISDIQAGSPNDGQRSTFQSLWDEAQSIVEKDTMVFPFTTTTGYMQLLRSLSVDYVYLQESLAGEAGETITQLQSWLRQDVVLVVGTDGGHGGLADSDDDTEQNLGGEEWWQRDDRAGRGRGVVVVEGIRVGDDWARRIMGHE